MFDLGSRTERKTKVKMKFKIPKRFNKETDVLERASVQECKCMSRFLQVVQYSK